MKGLQYDILLNSVQLIFVVPDFVFKTKRKKRKNQNTLKYKVSTHFQDKNFLAEKRYLQY